MAVFDPTKPFERVAVKFDPSQPFETEEQAAAAKPGMLESLLRGAAQGASLNFADEMTARAESVLGSLGLVPDKTYEQALAESRANYHSAEEAHPIASTLGGVGGGIATAFVPGLGAAKLAQGAGLGAKVWSAGKLGAKLGAVGALGASEDKSLEDAIKGGAAGAALGAGGQALVSGLGAGGRWLVSKLHDAIKPDTQLALAVGATGADLNTAKPLAAKLTNAVKTLESRLFHAPEAGVLDEGVLWERVQAIKQDTGQEIGDLVSRVGSSSANPEAYQNLRQTIGVKLRQIIEQKTPPDMREGLGSKFVQAYDELINTGGNLEKLWRLKSNSGHWAGNAWLKAGLPPPLQEGYMSMNHVLNDFLFAETAKLGDDTLRALNNVYHAAATIEPVLGKRIGVLEGAASSLGLSARDLGAGGMLAAAATGLGAGGIAAPLGFAGAGLNQYMRSVPGRVARAHAGRALEQQAQKLSELTGAIPRNVKGAQDWLKQHLPTLPPQVQQVGAAIVGAPPDRAEKMIRGIMPQFAQYFARSKYPSELDGKVSEMGDKMSIRRGLEKLQLPSGQMALRLAALNHDGTIPVEVYSPEEAMDQLEEFAQRMGQMTGGGQIP
jgi:hypothetical protein